MSGNTKQITIGKQNEGDIRNIITSVYDALSEKGYSAIEQMVEYLLTEEPTYITNHKNARSLVRRIDRHELLAAMLKEYLGL